MRRLYPLIRSLPVFALLLLAACEGGTAELIQEIDAAREGCTEEKLKAGAEECVRMMERYAEMGTEAIETYIGAVKSLDQALERMPPVRFDTAGLGHALSRPPEEYLRSDSLRSAGDLYPSRAGDAWNPRGYEPAAGWEDPASAYPSAPDPEWSPRYRDDGWSRPPAPYAEPDPRDPYSRGGYGSDYPYDAQGQGWREGSRDAYPAPYGREPRQGIGDWRYGEPRAAYPAPRGRSVPGREARPYAPREASPPARGRLLPPEERLRRPWIEEEPMRDPAPRRAPRVVWPDTIRRR